MGLPELSPRSEVSAESLLENETYHGEDEATVRLDSQIWRSSFLKEGRDVHLQRKVALIHEV